MTKEEASKWLENLKSDIGKMQFRALWGYEQAMDEIIDLLSADSEWIPCSERLPKTGDSILVTYSDGEVDIIWSARPKAWVTYSERNNLIYPLAWMLLPKPYKESEVEE